jgi:hypothetical protein
VAELPDYAQTPVHAVKVSRYLTHAVTQGLAIRGQPRQQYYWHRPLHRLLNAAFEAGLVLDRIEEPPAPRPETTAGPFDWASYDVPPLLFGRLRAPDRLLA